MGIDSSGASESHEALIQEIVTAHKQLRGEFVPTEVVQEFDEWPSSTTKKKYSRLATFLRRGDNILARTANVVKAANSEYEFHIQRKDSRSDWRISEVKARSQNAGAYPTDVSLAMARNSFAPFLRANHIPIDELLTHPSVRVTSVSNVQLGDKTLTTIQTVVDDPAARLENGLDVRFASVSLYFAPESTGWIPVRIEVRGPLGDGIDKVLRNFTSVAGKDVPLQFRWTGRRPDGTEWLLTEGTDEFGFDEVPEEVFYLSHYGLPEPDFGSNVSTPYRLVIGTALTAGILIVVILLWRRERAHS